MSFLAWPYWGMFASGLLLTLQVSALAYAGALVLGVIGVMCRASRILPLRWMGAAYVESIRNVPSLALVFIAVFGLPQIGVDAAGFRTTQLPAPRALISGIRLSMNG